MKKDLDAILSGIEELEPLPITAVNLAKAVADEAKGINDFVEIIKMDQAITANVLKMANSALSFSVNEITDLKSAVIRLGGTRILSEIVGKHLSPKLSNGSKFYGFHENDLWRHSVAAALSTTKIKEVSKLQVPSISFIAALLHDIGKLIITRNAPDEIISGINKNLLKGMTFEESERDIIGFSHCDAGATLASHWKLPDDIIKAIQDHHNENAEHPVTDIVKMANTVAKIIGEGIGFEGMQFKLGDDLFERLKIDRQNDFEIICMDTKCELDETLKMFQM